MCFTVSAALGANWEQGRTANTEREDGANSQIRSSVRVMPYSTSLVHSRCYVVTMCALHFMISIYVSVHKIKIQNHVPRTCIVQTRIDVKKKKKGGWGHLSYYF